MWTPKEIFVEDEVNNFPLTKEVLSRFPDVPTRQIGYREEVVPHDISAREKQIWAKQRLRIGLQKGDPVRLFRVLPGLVGREEYHIYAAHGCPGDCQYCYLTDYFENQIPMIFANQEEILDNIKSVLEQHPKAFYHAGITSDSLAFEDMTGLCKELISLFKKFPKSHLELRTKFTNAIEFYKSLESIPENIIPSWTLSPQNAMNFFERGTASLDTRLEAAKMAISKGSKVGWRLDPMIIYDGWEDDYKNLIDRVCTEFTPEQMETIVIGGLRHSPPLKEKVLAKYPDTSLFVPEMILGCDGKCRYFKSLRIRLFKMAIESFRKNWGDKVKLVLSMEGPEVWEESGLPVPEFYHDIHC